MHRPVGWKSEVLQIDVADQLVHSCERSPTVAPHAGKARRRVTMAMSDGLAREDR